MQNTHDPETSFNDFPGNPSRIQNYRYIKRKYLSDVCVAYLSSDTPL